MALSNYYMTTMYAMAAIGESRYILPRGKWRDHFVRISSNASATAGKSAEDEAIG